MPATMTRQHFELLARTVREMDEQVPILTPSIVAHRLANALEQTNTDFDRERFLTACEKERNQ